MTTKDSSQKKRRIKFIPILVGLAALSLIFIAGGFAFAARQETQDSFCASCHTQPESTFFQRSTDVQAVDLASYHKPQNARCIDCHSGQGILGRVQAELLGARNAFLWYTGTAIQPAKLSVPIQDANCLKCHENVIQKGYIPKLTVPIGSADREEEGEAGINHWHEDLARWQANVANAGSCVSCHSGHMTDGAAQTGYQNIQTTRKVCDACHLVLRREEGG